MTRPATPVRVAARALIVIDGRVLLVNAYPGFARQLWCAPGGGCNAHEAVTETLRREVREETGLEIEPGPLAGVSEFHAPAERSTRSSFSSGPPPPGRPSRDGATRRASSAAGAWPRGTS